MACEAFPSTMTAARGPAATARERAIHWSIRFISQRDPRACDRRRGRRRLRPTPFTRAPRSLPPALPVFAGLVLWAHFDGGYFGRLWYPSAIGAVLLLVGSRSARGGSSRVASGPDCAPAAPGTLAWSFLSMAWADSPGSALEAASKLLLVVTLAWALVLLPWRPRAGLALLWPGLSGHRGLRDQPGGRGKRHGAGGSVLQGPVHGSARLRERGRGVASDGATPCAAARQPESTPAPFECSSSRLRPSSRSSPCFPKVAGALSPWPGSRSYSSRSVRTGCGWFWGWASWWGHGDLDWPDLPRVRRRH